MPRAAAAALLAGAAVSSTGCIFGGKKSPPPRVFVPPPVAARVAPQPVRIELPRLPDIAVENPPAPEWISTNLPAPAVAPPKPAPPAKPPARPAEETAAVAAPPAVTAPKPVQILSTEQQRIYGRQYDESVQSARGVLAVLAGKNLTAAQRGEVNQINAFLRQAEQARESDLSTAVEFARRADLLAKDLLGRLP
jgi:hypothetical protein